MLGAGDRGCVRGGAAVADHAVRGDARRTSGAGVIRQTQHDDHRLPGKLSCSIDLYLSQSLRGSILETDGERGARAYKKILFRSSSYLLLMHRRH